MTRTAVVILGASGDLARRKLIPALQKLHGDGDLPEDSIIVGSGRSDFSDESFREHFGVPEDFASILHYHRNISGLKGYLAQKGRFAKIVFFLALPPSACADTAAALAGEGFHDEAILVVEKPFGYDYDSSRKLNRDLAHYQIIIKIQPAEGIILDLAGKVPGGELRITNTNMNFCYRDSFGGEVPEAYQRLLLDAIRGDRTLFVSAEETELLWDKLVPFLDKGPVSTYSKGQAPDPCRMKNWIDFASYGSICA